MSAASRDLGDFHKSLIDEKFKAFVIARLKKTFQQDFQLIENDIQELLVYGSLREIQAKASQKIISQKKI